MVAAAMAPEAILGKYEQLVKDRAKICDLIETAERKMNTLAGEKQGLLKAIADGDRRSSARADEIDKQRTHVDREIGGLRIKLTEFDGAIAELNGPRQAVFQERADQAKAKRFSDAKASLEIRLHNAQAHYRSACRELYEASEELYRHQADPLLDEPQRALMMSSFLMDLANAVNTSRVNEHWKHARGPVRPVQVPLVAAKPPEHKKHLENIR